MYLRYAIKKVVYKNSHEFGFEMYSFGIKIDGYQTNNDALADTLASKIQRTTGCKKQQIFIREYPSFNPDIFGWNIKKIEYPHEYIIHAFSGHTHMKIMIRY